MTATTERQVSVAELKRSWRALQSAPLTDEPYAGRPAPTGIWVPERGRVSVVLGCGGGVGASTTALAIAEAAGTPCRLIECAPPPTSGLAGATTAELGDTGRGWRRGTRGHVLIERSSQNVLAPIEVPLPADGDTSFVGAVVDVVVDVAWPCEAILARACWLRELLVGAAAVVLVTTATVPGLRRLETTLALLAAHREVGREVGRDVAAVLGPRLARWPGQLRHGAGPRTKSLGETGRVVAIPCDRRIAITGPDSTPLPPALLTAATALLELLPMPATTTTSPSALKGSTQ